MTDPKGNSEFCFPRISMSSETKSRETLIFGGKTLAAASYITIGDVGIRKEYIFQGREMSSFRKKKNIATVTSWHWRPSSQPLSLSLLSSPCRWGRQRREPGIEVPLHSRSESHLNSRRISDCYFPSEMTNVIKLIARYVHGLLLSNSCNKTTGSETGLLWIQMKLQRIMKFL